MKCPNCGKNLSDDSKFCTKCGTPLRMQAPGGAPGNMSGRPAAGPGGNMPGRSAAGPGAGNMPGRPAAGPGGYRNYPPYGAPEPPKKKKGFLLPLLIILLLAAVGGGAVFAVKHRETDVDIYFLSFFTENNNSVVRSVNRNYRRSEVFFIFKPLIFGKK